MTHIIENIRMELNYKNNLNSHRSQLYSILQASLSKGMKTTFDK